MAVGTGLPVKRDYAEAQSTPVAGVVHIASSAGAWGQIAKAGEQLSNAGERALYQSQVGHLAEQEIEISRKQIELRNQYAFEPEKFKAAWNGVTEGKIAEAPSWAVPKMKIALGRYGNSAYSGILNETRARDFRLDGEKVATLATQKANDVIGAAMAGTLIPNDPDGTVRDPRIIEYRSVLQTAVTSRLHSQEWADLHMDDVMSKAHGEVVARSAVEIYHKPDGGYVAASEHLKKNILENEDLKLSIGAKRAAYARGMQAINGERTRDRMDLGEWKQEAKELIEGFKANLPIEHDAVRSLLRRFEQAGAVNDYTKLFNAYQTKQLMAPLIEGNMSPAAGAAYIAGMRSDWMQARGMQPATIEKAKVAMSFFAGQNLGPHGAAGIVGNLLQEGPLDPNLSHDGGTGIGIAGWRLERRTALRQFAAARGKTENDFDTQMQFVVHELNTSERGVLERLRQARSPAEAAEAFISFERPQGWSAANPRAGHGFGNRVRNAQMMAGAAAGAPQPGAVTTDAGATAAPPADLPAGVVRAVQQGWVANMKRMWPGFQKSTMRMGEGQDEHFAAMHQAAQLSGDQTWQRDVENQYVAYKIGREAKDLPVGQRQAVLDQLSQRAAEGGASFDADVVLGTVQKEFEARDKQAREDPVSYAIDRRDQKAPEPLDFGRPDTLAVGIAQRVTMARGVAEAEGIPVASPFRVAERQALAGAISGGDPKKALAAINAVAAVPPDMQEAVFEGRDNPIKEALRGAATSTDPTKMTVAMSALDGFWRRNPHDFGRVFGEKALTDLQTWQGMKDTYSPAEVVESFAKARDPKEQAAREIVGKLVAPELAKIKVGDVVSGFNKSWVPFTGPSEPQNFEVRGIDGLQAERLKGEFDAVYTELRKSGVSADQAASRANERLATSWGVSGLTGTLMRHNPEKYYPKVNGSHAWMKPQVEQLIAGIKSDDPAFAVDTSAVGGAPAVNFQFRTLVADAQTEAEIANKRPPSYRVIVRNTQTGRDEVLTDNTGNSRFAFDPATDIAGAEREGRAARQRFESGALFDALYGAPAPGASTAVP